MNILINFLVTNFSKKFGLSKDDLKNYMLYQTNNSGVIYNGELLKADNEEKLIYLTKELVRHYKQQENMDIFINKVNERYKSPSKFFNYINNKINLTSFEDLKNIEQLENFKLNFLELIDEILYLLNAKLKVKGIQLSNLTNILKDSNLLGNWTIKPDRHIDCVVPLLSINNQKMINISRDETKPDIFEHKKVFPEISKVYSKKIIEQKKNLKNSWKKNELEKINIIFHSYDYCFQHNLNNEKKINPKLLDRTIFLYSSYDYKGYLQSHKFHKEFEEKTKNNFFKNTKEYEKHNELINSLSF
jgi:hypothetical protein